MSFNIALLTLILFWIITPNHPHYNSILTIYVQIYDYLFSYPLLLVISGVDDSVTFTVSMRVTEFITTINNIPLKTLKVPNYEVEATILENLINKYSNTSYVDFLEYTDKLINHTIVGNEKKIIETIGDYLSSILTN